MAQISLIILITDTRYWIEGDDIELAYSLTFYSNYVGMPEAIQISTANEKKKRKKGSNVAPSTSIQVCFQIIVSA